MIDGGGGTVLESRKTVAVAKGYNTIRYDTIRYDPIQYTIRYNTCNP